MATWRVQIKGKQRPVIDPDQLLGAVLALGRQFAEEQRQRQLRDAARAQSTGKPEEQPPTEQKPAASMPEAR